MTLLHHQRAGMLWQHRPELFPEGRLTDTELVLWSKFHAERNHKHG